MAIDLHIIPRIHILIATYCLFLIYVFVIVGLGIVPVFGNGRYFRFGTPVILEADPTRVLIIDDMGTSVAIMMLLGLEQFVHVVLSEVMEWKKSSEIPMVAVYSGIITYYLRYALHVIFMRSQISFVVSIVFMDLLATAVCKTISIRQRKKIARNGWSQVNMTFVCIVQIACIPLLFSIYIYSGLFQSAYFKIGTPLIIFGTTDVDNKVHYWVIAVCVFAWASLSTVARNNIDHWHNSVLQNPGVINTGLTKWETRAIALNRIVIFYIGLMFLYSFITTQFFFVVIYMLADMLMTTIWKLRKATREKETSDKEELIHDWGIVLVVTMAQALFEVVVVAIVITSHWFNDTYFTWGEGVNVFGTLVPDYHQVAILLAYVAFERLAATLDTNIVQSDLAAWLYGGIESADFDSYSPSTILYIVIATRIGALYYFVLRIQFVLTNYSFVVVAAAVDIPLIVTVDEFHLVHKDSTRRNQQTDYFLKTTQWPTGQKKTLSDSESLYRLTNTPSTTRARQLPLGRVE